MVRYRIGKEIRLPHNDLVDIWVTFLDFITIIVLLMQ